MIKPCPFLCTNKNSFGYCLNTACINPNYNYLYNTSQFYNYSNPCQNCPNHPNNGGSGICHCTLGSVAIKY